MILYSKMLVKFYQNLFIGFTFDAYDFYRNLSESVSPEVGQLTVHFAPTFESFDKTLKYDPEKGETLHVPVRQNIPLQHVEV